ncbi:PIN domain-containing protein [Metallosphaera yellowstonensis]|jgi:Uncharacterized proteins of PilT N-term./Vapc superfamily
MGSNRRLGVLVDTNILLYVYDGVDPFSKVLEFLDFKPRFYIHTVVLNELSTLEGKYARSTKMLSRIRLAREYLRTYGGWWETVDLFQELPPDEALLRTAVELGLVIFTNDIALKKLALKNSIGIIFMSRWGKIIKSVYTI